jgi:hypothetical protein
VFEQGTHVKYLNQINFVEIQVTCVINI